LTAYARAEDRMKVLQGGFQLHLAKPVDPAELIVAVAVLAKRSPERPPESRLPNV
jgi:CheY-like chemotaxis protein